MAVNDLYQLTDVQSYFGQECVNVWWFQQLQGVGDAMDLAEAFASERLPTIVGLQSNEVLHERIVVVNYNNLSDFAELAPTAFNRGVRISTPLPPFVAWGFKLNRPTRAIRSGAKRFVGVTEGDIAGNEPDPDFLDNLQLAAEIFESTFTGAGENRYQPQIVRLNRETGQVVFDVGINSVSWNRITTQNSRKR